MSFRESLRHFQGAVLSAAQMRECETSAISAGRATGLELMERAGQRVVDAIFETWPDFSNERQTAFVLCGPGNNGGDGFVIARLLRDMGWRVHVHLLGDLAEVTGDTGQNAQRWQAQGGDIAPIGQLVQDLSDTAFDLFIDAGFGTGLNRSLLGAMREIALWLNERVDSRRWRVVSVDLPSGLFTDSGRAEEIEQGGAIIADLTVTFHRPKLGHFLDMGPLVCGTLSVADIGLSDASSDREQEATLAHPVELRKRAGHKYSHGHAVVLSGGPGRTGAARLAARGALRVGAGLVTVACPMRAVDENAAQLTAVMVQAIDGPAGFGELLEDARVSALCLGPGLGLSMITTDLVRVALEARKPTVLDADALTRFERAPETLFAQLHGDVVLTPHEGEFRRLFPALFRRMKEEGLPKTEATRLAAEQAGCTVLFKGPDTVIATPDGRCVVNAASYGRAVPWLATAGAGDVLAGIITGILARGVDPMSAAETGAWLHVEAARHFGPGLIAEDLAEQLPTVFRQMGY